MKDKPVKPQVDDAKSARKKQAGLGREVQVKIGQHLRAMYDEVLREGVPDHLAKLLNQLDTSTNSNGKSDSDKESQG